VLEGFGDQQLQSGRSAFQGTRAKVGDTRNLAQLPKGGQVSKGLFVPSAVGDVQSDALRGEQNFGSALWQSTPAATTERRNDTRARNALATRVCRISDAPA